MPKLIRRLLDNQESHSGVSEAISPTLLKSDAQNQLSAWFCLYMQLDGRAAADSTVVAKCADIHRFLDYFQRVTQADRPDSWTRSLSEDFVKALQRQKARRTNRPLSPTTIN